MGWPVLDSTAFTRDRQWCWVVAHPQGSLRVLCVLQGAKGKGKRVRSIVLANPPVEGKEILYQEWPLHGMARTGQHSIHPWSAVGGKE